MAGRKEERRRELEAKLSDVEERFTRLMRERGFDTTQVENIALPGALVKLYAEREELRAELEELQAERKNVRRVSEKNL